MRRTTLNIRTTTETKYLLQRAADMLGTTVSGFLLNSAMEKAHDIIQEQKHFFLDESRWDIFCTKLDCKPSKNQKLHALLNDQGIFKE